MKNSMSGCYYKRQALHGLVATGQGSQVKPYTYNYYVSKHNNCVSTHNNYTYLSPHNKLFIVEGERGSLADMASSQEALSLHFSNIMQNNHVALIMHPASIMKVCLLVAPSSAS